MPVRQLPARRAHGHAQPQGAGQLRAQLLVAARRWPARDPAGYTSYPEEESGPKLRQRSETFADHYSQARQFFISQTPVEQTHMRDAFVFELSKVETPAIRARMVSHLLHVDQALAEGVASGLGLSPLPEPARAARLVVEGLEPSPALSILKTGRTALQAASWASW